MNKGVFYQLQLVVILFVCVSVQANEKLSYFNLILIIDENIVTTQVPAVSIVSEKGKSINCAAHYKCPGKLSIVDSCLNSLQNYKNDVLLVFHYKSKKYEIRIPSGVFNEGTDYLIIELYNTDIEPFRSYYSYINSKDDYIYDLKSSGHNFGIYIRKNYIPSCP